MDRTLRTIGILASGVALVAAAVFDAPEPRAALSPMGWLHFGLPIYLYVFSQCWIDEGRARERSARRLRGDDLPRPPSHDAASSPAHEAPDGARTGDRPHTPEP
ncbi:hypothetical protein [Sorangium sp. So ce362]|uniref:hypothetical protein n=1 Tax=Sorangium sp. So ce362 TaxID=3133303 RepID=UPI003F5EE6B4